MLFFIGQHYFRIINMNSNNISVLPYPFPYKAWLTISNDPDNTLSKDWKELHRTIWKELKLPFSDSLFVDSYNKNIPEQVNLKRNPEIVDKHYIDTIHTWGDYMHAGKIGFERENALEAIEELKKHNINPLVWVDHANFEGNLLHNYNAGGNPNFIDAAGHVYKNYVYTLDLIKKIGVKYIWDGKITDFLGQDRVLSPNEYYLQYSSSIFKAWFKIILNFLYKGFDNLTRPGFLNYADFKNNNQYKKHTFDDGNTFYIFKRFGTWVDADIDGLGKLISKKNIDTLIKVGGTCIVYTHLGKRKANRLEDKVHIPIFTLNALINLKHRFEQKELMLSSVSSLLKYLIIRDNIEIEGTLIFFKADNIAYKKINNHLLKGLLFSFETQAKIDLERLLVESDEGKLAYNLIKNSDRVFTLEFI